MEVPNRNSPNIVIASDAFSFSVFLIAAIIHGEKTESGVFFPLYIKKLAPADQRKAICRDFSFG